MKERSLSLRGPEGPVNLKRTRRPPGQSADVDRDTSMDQYSMAERSDTFLSKRRSQPANYENTYRMEPDVPISVAQIERITESILAETLAHVQYDPNTCKDLSQDIAARIMDRIKTMPFKRYKLVAIVSIGSMKDRCGLQFGSRCLWNQATDTFASVKFSNGSLFAVAMIYGLYYEWHLDKEGLLDGIFILLLKLPYQFLNSSSSQLCRTELSCTQGAARADSRFAPSQ